jgi:hypothetical protein
MINLKRVLQLILLIQSLNICAQFPAPNNFIYTLNYIELDQWGVCDEQTVYGPSYCSYFIWNYPDTFSTEAILEHFEIYNILNCDTILVHSLSDTTFITTTPYEGYLYVIAAYSNPLGKSAPSNIVYIPGIPIGIQQTVIIPDIDLKYNSENDILIIESEKKINNIKILNIEGQTVFNNWNTAKHINIRNLKPGIYIVEIIYDINQLYQKKIIKK